MDGMRTANLLAQSGQSLGTLNGAEASPASTVNLTSEGSIDWAHWGLSSASSFDHKTGVTQRISNYTEIGSNPIAQYSNNPNGYTWSNGTPDGSASNTTTGIWVYGTGDGFRITVPGGTTQHTLRVYVGVWKAQGTFSASLSDGSASSYTNSTLNNSSGTTNGVYIITFAPALANQTLTITFTVANSYDPYGNVTLQAATLQ